MYEIITIPFNSVTKTFTTEDLNAFCINKKFISTKIEFFKNEKQAYWKVFIEYETILENKINEPSGLTEAAKVCADYTVEVSGVTYDDWYLPSQDELNKLYLNRASVGGFASDYYWSSSEYSANRAWGQHFSSGGQYDYYKNATNRVRAVRAF